MVSAGFHIVSAFTLLFLQTEAGESSLQKKNSIIEGDTSQKKCPNWDTTYPYSNGVDSKCWFSVSYDTKKKFLHEVSKNSYSLVNFVLHFDNVSTTESRCVIQGNKWTWTFPGPKGARQYLDWPLEYRVWSLGLLSMYTLDDFSVPLTVHGDCSGIQYGANETTQRISLALANLTDYLVSNTRGGDKGDSLTEYYNQSYWCYRERIYIDSHLLYMLCLNVICPLEAIGYRCCRWKWHFLNQTRTLECSGRYIKYREVGWLLPFVIGLTLYMFCPLMLVWLLKHVHELTFSHTSNYLELSDFDAINYEVHEQEKSENWIFYNPVHIGTIISHVFRGCCLKYPILISRIVRIIFLFASISVLGLKLLVHGVFQYDNIIASVNKGVPKDFESILSGYEKSRKNFLRMFGGPYVACLFYAVCYTISTCVPSDLAKFLAKGLVKEESEFISPLMVMDSIRVRFGAMKTTDIVNGYHEIFRTLLSEFFMILNPSFWKFSVITQCSRWRKYFRVFRRKSALFGRLFLLLTPLYIMICILELLLCLIRYGIPWVGFAKTIIIAYVIAPWRGLSVGVPIKIIFGAFSIFFVIFTMYMFSIIFVDSFIFMCDVSVYTYAGLFAHPEITYGYLIFSSTVLMYMFDSVHTISKVYDHLFHHVRKICKKMHKYNKYPDVELFKREDECKGIPRDLFFLVVKKYLPIRHQVFMSFLKLIVIVIVLYISVDLLYEFSANRNLNILTQAAATIIVCLVPKFLGDSCSVFRNRRHHSQSHQIKHIIKTYCQRSKEAGFMEHVSNLEVL